MGLSEALQQIRQNNIEINRQLTIYGKDKFFNNWFDDENSERDLHKRLVILYSLPSCLGDLSSFDNRLESEVQQLAEELRENVSRYIIKRGNKYSWHLPAGRPEDLKMYHDLQEIIRKIGVFLSNHNETILSSLDRSLFITVMETRHPDNKRYYSIINGVFLELIKPISREGYSVADSHKINDKITIGRSDHNDIVIKGDRISRNHATIRLNSVSNYEYDDKKSSNGTLFLRPTRGRTKDVEGKLSHLSLVEVPQAIINGQIIEIDGYRISFNIGRPPKIIEDNDKSSERNNPLRPMSLSGNKFMIISDVHGNIDAFESVLDNYKQHVDFVLSLGDVVGYGPSSIECLEHLNNAYKVVSILGNHEEFLLNGTGVGTQDLARESLGLLRNELNHGKESDLQKIKDMYMYMILKTHTDLKIGLFHGAPMIKPNKSSLYTYVGTERGFKNPKEVFEENEELFKHVPVVFVGHTHIPAIYVYDPRTKKIYNPDIPNHKFRIEPNKYWYIINPGSVGFQRSSPDKRASFLLFDVERLAIQFFRQEYDIEAVKRKIVDSQLSVDVKQQLLRLY